MENKSIFGISFREHRKHAIPAIVELIATEEEYIKKMDKVVNGYMAEYLDEKSTIAVPDHLKDVEGILIFANIKEIYQWHKDYLLEALIEHQNSPSELGKVFTQNENQFHMYAKYCNNKEISHYLVNINQNYFDKVKKKLGHKLELNDLLITPVQRLGRYELLLSQIIKHLKKNEQIEHLDDMNDAFNMIQTVCKNVNEFTALQGIQNFDGLISAQGKLLFHGQLTCNYDGRKRKLYVFLFKRSIIFTDKNQAKSKYVNPTYNFRLQIPMNKLHMKELPNLRFLLSSTDPHCSDLNIVCYAATIEIHQLWLNAIRNQLSKQSNLILDLVNPSTNEEPGEVLL